MTDSEKIDAALAKIRAEKEQRSPGWYERPQPVSNERISDAGGRGWSGGSWRGDSFAGGRQR
jgi:hypothetical protein